MTTGDFAITLSGSRSLRGAWVTHSKQVDDVIAFAAGAPTFGESIDAPRHRELPYVSG
jgi:hypothetical protein